ncbi:type II toxin-antitoxin system Phd/YefM family antitoxin [Georgenia sp. TF02-10]|uniref:type II toxin-antitoxin system Phd/YefM family antitoxin n=1 Tax=Georgenia sp. TF02-10 TaxID=2917725 RepID=UPI001FA7810A|nr:type II toxin-antitoxin system Phd/YefM family antitoxin [Georgenia sp. TF02-10]UNX54816.1 type II toxin-antitoxin system Phd/YefM family antitoxin [Georgenia sp. TF02-10]
METVSSTEARTHFSRLLDDVARGHSFTITRHGRRVARLVPADDRVEDTASVIEELRAARRGVTLSGSVRDLVDAGRR